MIRLRRRVVEFLNFHPALLFEEQHEYSFRMESDRAAKESKNETAHVLVSVESCS